MPSWARAIPREIIEAATEILKEWPNPDEGHQQPGAKESTAVPRSKKPELCRRLVEIQRQGGNLSICVAIGKRAIQEWRDGAWIKAAQNFFGKAKDAPWQAYYQAHVTNQAAEVQTLQAVNA